MTTTNAAGVVVDHRIGSRGTLTIRVAAAEIRLAGTDGDRVAVRTPDGRTLSDRVVIETTDDGISIREKSGISFGRGHRTVQLEIEVPAEAAISVETASGWIDGQGLRGEQQRYRTVSGEIGLRAGAGRIDVGSVSGDVRLDLASAATIGIKSVSGDVTLTGGRLDAIRVQTTSGDVRVDSPLVGRTGNAIETLSGDVDLVVGDGIRVEARTVSGDLTTNLPHRSEGRMGRRTLIVGDGEIELGFRSVSGDLRIRGTAESRAPRPVTAPAWATAPALPDLPQPPEPPEFPELPEPPALPGSPWTVDGRTGSTAVPSGDLATLGDELAGLHDELASVGRELAGITRDMAGGGDGVAPGDEVAAPDDEPIDADRMAILRSLEQGDLDVAAAMDLLAALDERTSGEGAGSAGEEADV